MGESGSTTVEMILWMPILLLIMGIIVQLSLYFNARNAVQAAAFEATRQAVVSINPEETALTVASSYAKETLPGWAEGDRLATTVAIKDRGSANEAVAVSITYDTPGFLLGVIGKDKSAGLLKAFGSSEMEIEERP